MAIGLNYFHTALYQDVLISIPSTLDTCTLCFPPMPAIPLCPAPSLSACLPACLPTPAAQAGAKAEGQKDEQDASEDVSKEGDKDEFSENPEVDDAAAYAVQQLSAQSNSLFPFTLKKVGGATGRAAGGGAPSAGWEGAC